MVAQHVRGLRPGAVKGVALAVGDEVLHGGRRVRAEEGHAAVVRHVVVRLGERGDDLAVCVRLRLERPDVRRHVSGRHDLVEVRQHLHVLQEEVEIALSDGGEVAVVFAAVQFETVGGVRRQTRELVRDAALPVALARVDGRRRPADRRVGDRVVLSDAPDG